MSIGPLLSEIAHSSESPLFDKIALVLTWALLLVATLVVLVGGIRLWNGRYRNDGEADD